MSAASELKTWLEILLSANMGSYFGPPGGDAIAPAVVLFFNHYSKVSVR